MTKQIIEIGNESTLDGLKLYAKALLPKKIKDKNTIPSIIIRKNRFSFLQSDINYFADLVGINNNSPLIPPIYINLLAFRLQMHAILHDDFPYSAMGMVHISNKITQHKPFQFHEIDTIETYFDLPKTHNRGMVFGVITKVYDKNGIILVENYADQLKILNQGPKTNESKKEFVALTGESTEWSVAENIGRKFSKVNGDINPIHLFKLTAKLFGFKGHIAHGMYSVSRGLADLDKKIGEAQSFEYYTEFKQPVFLPGKAIFITKAKSPQEFDFELVNKNKSKLHMNGYFKVYEKPFQQTLN
jgi:acyl dehydratase